MSTEQEVVSADGARRFCQEVFQRADVPEIFLPGELEFRRREERLRHGLPVNAAVLEDARVIGRELGVVWPT